MSRTYAHIVGGVVIQSIVADPSFIVTLSNASEWVESTDDAGNPSAKNLASVGSLYNGSAFYSPQPYPSWTLNVSTLTWEAPIPSPNDGKKYVWNEANQIWDDALNIEKQDAIAKINNFHADIILMLQGNPTQAEINSWDAKLAGAIAILKNDANSQVYVAYLNNYGVTSPAEQIAWANSVTELATRNSTIIAIADLIRDTAITQVNAVTSTDQIQAILDNAKTQALEAASKFK